VAVTAYEDSMNNRFVPIILLCAAPLCALAQGAYPMVDRATQKVRDDERRLILETELEAERAALGKARQALATDPSDEHRADEHRHEQNIAALQRELGVKPAPVRLAARVRRVRAAATPPSAAGPAPDWDPFRRKPED
jgi:hypothetical protein